MNGALSPNTQAILLLTAPLIIGRSPSPASILSAGEYRRLARCLFEQRHQPADLLMSDAEQLLETLRPDFEPGRIRTLLERGFQLSQAVEHWQTRAIWVISRADAEYPARYKSRMKEEAPPVLYGCGERTLLGARGLAVVGSRDADDTLLHYATSVGRQASQAHCVVYSGGARGIDQAAMLGGLSAGGSVVGVLADSLERAVLNRDYRDALLEKRLALISPFDPAAGFNVGNAMSRNKLIFALADAALIVNSDYQKGGTWAGAAEQLDKLKYVRVYIRSTGESAKGLEGLRKKGALLWSNPLTPEAFVATLSATGAPEQETVVQDTLPLGAAEPAPITNEVQDTLPIEQASPVTQEAPALITEPLVAYVAQDATVLSPPIAYAALSPAEELFGKVRELMLQLVAAPQKEADVATELNITTSQAKAWLQRLVDEGSVVKHNRPVSYVIKPTELFDNDH